jgi:hypothetical protein
VHFLRVKKNRFFRYLSVQVENKTKERSSNCVVDNTNEFYTKLKLVKNGIYQQESVINDDALLLSNSKISDDYVEF